MYRKPGTGISDNSQKEETIMPTGEKVTVDVTTGIGTISFPHVFKSTATKNEKGEVGYDVQIIIPKTQRKDIRELLLAIKKVGEAKWGAKWKSVKTPLRDGDDEADELTEDGSTKGEKYPERKGAFFLNARTNKPVGVYDRQRELITDPGDLYGGCKGRISVTFYPYSKSGNTGIGAGLNGVQKIADGEPIGGGRPSLESMFDMLDDEDDFGLGDEEVEEEEAVEEAPKRRRAAKKAPAKKAAAKKTAAKKRKAEVVLEDEDVDDEDEEEYDDLDDLEDDI